MNWAKTDWKRLPAGTAPEYGAEKHWIDNGLVLSVFFNSWKWCWTVCCVGMNLSDESSRQVAWQVCTYKQTGGHWDHPTSVSSIYLRRFIEYITSTHCGAQTFSYKASFQGNGIHSRDQERLQSWSYESSQPSTRQSSAPSSVLGNEGRDFLKPDTSSSWIVTGGICARLQYST